ncbi:MAG: outer membrane lipid asymmetry maintenance protein MlaD [Alphaproteobacteria bacterium]|nr:outer membrane lipid asymmetry maintenance protein MlaD [Alphaproteobacteria bacterium]
MQNGFVETLLGAAVVAVAVFFFYYGWSATGAGTVVGYEVLARFDRVDGVAVGTDVRMAGIKIGSVTSQELDQKSYRALVKMNIKQGIALPDDSSVKVATEGLLGGTYLSVSPGGSDDMLKAGSEFATTQGSVDLLGLAMQSMMGGGDKKEEPAPAPSSAPATPQ